MQLRPPIAIVVSLGVAMLLIANTQAQAPTLKDILALPIPPECILKRDVTFVLDRSGSIKVQNWNDGLVPAVLGLVHFLMVNGTDSRIAAIGYDTEAELLWDFDKHKTKQDVFTAVQNINYPAGWTNTPQGLAMVRTSLIPAVKAPHVVILITDGETNRGGVAGVDDVKEANALKALGAKVVVIGVGNMGNFITALNAMASGPEYRADVKSYSDLFPSLQMLGKVICNAVSTKCKENVPLEVTFLLDKSDSIKEKNWRNGLVPAVNGIIDNIMPGDDNTVQTNIRVACVTFDQFPDTEWELGDHKTKGQYKKHMSTVEYTAATTATADGLDAVRTDIHPKRRSGARHLVFLITDGLSDAGQDTDTASKKLRDAGAEIFVISVQKHPDAKYIAAMDRMASGKDYRADVTSYDDLKAKLKDLSALLCSKS